MKRSRSSSSDKQTLLDHIRELQKRLLVCVGVFIIGGSIGYGLFDQIVAILRQPLGQDLYYSTPAGSFNFVIKICTMVGVAIALPVLIYNLMMFLRPAFERALSIKRAYILATASVMLSIAGVCFGYFMIIPGALHFFSGFQVNGLTALITADSYLNFVTNVIITFVIVFQIPLVMMLIDRIKPITPKKLISSEKYVIIGGLIVSVFVPFAFDITTSLLIALPIVALYNLSIGMIIWQHASLKRRAEIESHNLATELDIDDAILNEMLNDYEAESKDTHANKVVHNPDAKDVKRAGMEISKSSRQTIESMKQDVRLRRMEVIAERQARLKAIPQIFTPISDIK